MNQIPGRFTDEIIAGGILLQPVFQTTEALIFSITRNRCIQRYHSISDLYLPILIVRKSAYGIIYSKACEQQRSTAAYSYYHHKKTLFISEYISDTYLSQKFQSLPYKWDMLKEHPLARLRSLRPHKTCRSLRKLVSTGKPSCTYSAQKGCCQHANNQRPVCGSLKRHMYIHHMICIPDNLRKYICTYKISTCTSYYSCSSRIDHIFSHDSRLAIAESLQHAYHRALFLNHSVHGSHTHEHGNQYEEYRKYLCNSIHYV